MPEWKFFSRFFWGGGHGDLLPLPPSPTPMVWLTQSSLYVMADVVCVVQRVIVTVLGHWDVAVISQVVSVVVGRTMAVVTVVSVLLDTTTIQLVNVRTLASLSSIVYSYTNPNYAL